MSDIVGDLYTDDAGRPIVVSGGEFLVESGDILEIWLRRRGAKGSVFSGTITLDADYVQQGVKPEDWWEWFDDGVFEGKLEKRTKH